MQKAWVKGNDWFFAPRVETHLIQENNPILKEGYKMLLIIWYSQRSGGLLKGTLKQRVRYYQVDKIQEKEMQGLPYSRSRLSRRLGWEYVGMVVFGYGSVWGVQIPSARSSWRINLVR